jgi:hypothetical protein
MNDGVFTISDIFRDPLTNVHIGDFACPIQQGLPFLFNRAFIFLLWLAVAAFLIGILIAIFNYLTAYGDENKVKKGKDALKWTFIGALIVMLSAFIMQGWANALLAPRNSVDVIQTNPDGSSTVDINPQANTDSDSTSGCNQGTPVGPSNQDPLTNEQIESQLPK